MITTLLGVLGALALFVLPGSWVAGGMRLPTLSFRARLALAVVLSPPVLVLEFYSLRWIGLSFAGTVIALPLINLPALALLLRRARGVRLPTAAVALAWVATLAIPIAYLLVWMHDPEVRGNWVHAWTHADVVYMLANGQLRPEEPLLAGVRLAYPWFGHVYQGALSYLLGSAPNSNYLLTNVVWLLATIVFVAETVSRLGGGRVAQLTSAIWLGFGVNAVGYVGSRVFPAAFTDRYPIWGDDRYTPWLRKFGVFNQNVLGIGTFAALVLVLTDVDDEAPMGSSLILAGLLLITEAVVYPILVPAAAAIVGARMLMVLTRRYRAPAPGVPRELFALTLCLVAAAVVTAGHVTLVTADRSARELELSDVWSMKVKAATAIVVLLPLVVGVVASGWRSWKSAPSRTGVLLLTALASLVMYVAVNLHAPAAEYKFMFTAAVCLTPFAAMTSERWLPRAPAKGVPIAVLCVSLLVWPALDSLRPLPDPTTWLKVKTSTFDVRLLAEDPAADLTESVRNTSPANAVLVAGWSPFDWVTVTRRPLFVPPDTGFLHGLGFTADFLLKENRGYGAPLIDRRRATVRRLYGTSDPAERARTLHEIFRELGRPVVTIVRIPEDAALGAWIAGQSGARLLYSGPHLAAWLLTPDSSVVSRAVPYRHL